MRNITYDFAKYRDVLTSHHEDVLRFLGVELARVYPFHDVLKKEVCFQRHWR